MADNDFAVVVGINHYRGLADLSGAENDAAAFDEWLRSDTGGAVPGDHIAFLHNGANGAEHPRVAEIDDEFEKIHDLLEGDGGGRRLYIFLAGHGFDPEGDDAALLDATATTRRLGDHISGRLYMLWHQKARLFEQVVLIMDCCRDDYRRVPIRRPPWIHDDARVGPDAARFTGLATRWAQKARERPDPDDNGKMRGLYSRALLGVLNAGEVTGEELKRYTMNGLSLLARGGQFQEPEIHTDAGFVFSEGAGSPRGTLRLHASRERLGHTFRVNDKEGDPMDARVMDDQPWVHPDLPFGLYVVTDEDTGKTTNADVSSRRVDVTL